jgi:enamine deaminase RidA (YjgF/YER057c/UK114 family)
MSKQTVFGERAKRTLAQPIGPYSHGVVASGSRIVFIAGQLAWGPDGDLVGKGDLGAQYRQVMRNIQAIVEDAGGTMADICKIVNYVTRGIFKGELQYGDITEARKEFIPGDFPVSTLVEVTSLMDADALVEVDAIAVLD